MKNVCHGRLKWGELTLVLHTTRVVSALVGGFTMMLGQHLVTEELLARKRAVQGKTL